MADKPADAPNSYPDDVDGRVSHQIILLVSHHIDDPDTYLSDSISAAGRSRGRGEGVTLIDSFRTS